MKEFIIVFELYTVPGLRAEEQEQIKLPAFSRPQVEISKTKRTLLV